MIVKYKSGEMWGYIDNVSKVLTQDIDTVEFIQKYDKEVAEGQRTDIASVIDFTNEGSITISGYDDGCNTKTYSGATPKQLPDEIARVNKVFTIATETLPEEMKDEGYHSENLLDTQLLIDNIPAYVILVKLLDTRSFENVVFVTNQKVYLMNDKGQTIERLV
ncbi:MAG: hypothetical protein PHQ35_09450 [Phycisphaerae bacterium]|nr:hypothetical protein [Phycisphaerae bacterium]MDD5239942.1 hypothetical protein [Candidatus Nanoarchaeia archaeon]